MLIYNRDNRECGRIIGRRELKTTVQTLAQVWKEEIASLPQNDNTRRIKPVIAAHPAYEYPGEPVGQKRKKLFCLGGGWCHIRLAAFATEECPFLAGSPVGECAHAILAAVRVIHNL